MPDAGYSHRTLAAKLGLKPGMRVRVSGDVSGRVGGSIALRTELDAIIRGVGSEGETEEVFERARPALLDHPAIWVVTRKQGHPKYVKQEDLIALGNALCDPKGTTSQ